jgi:hypothetical protein
MTEMAERYKMAEEIVLKRYATELGQKGQCQKWKITAIANDRKDGRLDTSVLELFMEDVSREVERLLSVKPIVQELCKKACEPVAVAEKKPVEPEPSLPESPHGIDLDWN